MASSCRSTCRVLCERAARQRAGRRARRRAGAAGRTALHCAAGGRRRNTKIQQRIYQGERISRLANSWRPHAYQLIVAQSTAAWHTQTTRKRRSVHSAGAADRVCDGSGRMLAVGQLLVAGARGHTGGWVTHAGGRVHARVAPAIRGGSGGGGARHGGLVVAGAAAAAARAAAHAAACRAPPLPQRLPQPALRTAAATAEVSRLLTRPPRALMSCT